MIPVKIVQERLSNYTPTSSNDLLTIPLTEIGWQLKLAFQKADTIGCRLWEITCQRIAAGGWTYLVKKKAESLAKRVSGLLEPLCLYEYDAVRDVALLRSHTPTFEGEQRSFYNLLIARDSITLTRIMRGLDRKSTPDTSSGHNRDMIPFSLTYDALFKFLTDLGVE